jgi:DNA invertase Pin-like site-specific DNA recombinase
MLYVLDVVQDQRVTVMLARETFDPKMAPVKAWVAGMELDSLNERMTMGVKARLRAGKANTGQDRYGYQRVGEKIIIVEEEAKWVRNIFPTGTTIAHAPDGDPTAPYRSGRSSKRLNKTDGK